MIKLAFEDVVADPNILPNTELKIDVRSAVNTPVRKKKRGLKYFDLISFLGSCYQFH